MRLASPVPAASLLRTEAPHLNMLGVGPAFHVCAKAHLFIFIKRSNVGHDAAAARQRIKRNKQTNNL